MTISGSSDRDVVEQLLLACETAASLRELEPLRAVSREFHDAAMRDSAVALRAAQALDTLPLEAAAWLGILLGALVEDGLEPQRSWRHLLTRFRAATASPPPLPAAGDGGKEESEVFIDALTKLSQALVAYLARLPEERAELASDEGFHVDLDRIDDHGPGATWVRAAISRVSGRIVVLHVEAERGYRAEYQNIGNCFHLFTLLQRAIGDRLPGGHVPQSPLPSVENADSAWWHYGHALSPKPDLLASIWGEASPKDIPVIDGEQIVLLWPPLLKQRSWDASFLGCELAAMPAMVNLGDPLSEQEAAELLDRLDIVRSQRQASEPAPTRKWWRLWTR